MNLDEWSWRNKITLKQIGDDLGISQATMSHIKCRKSSPRLENALMLHQYSGGEISLLELVPHKVKKKILLIKQAKKVKTDDIESDVAVKEASE